MRTYLDDERADATMIGVAIGIAVTLVLSVMIIFSILGGLSPTFNALEDDLNGSSGEVGHPNMPDNASVAKWGNSSAEFANYGLTQTQAQLNTFYTIAPLILVVVAAVIILAYITRIGGGSGE